MLRKMKILIENPLIWGGGSETLLQDMVTYFMRDYDFTVLTDPAEPELFPAAKDPSVRWIRRRWGWQPLPRFSPAWLANRIGIRVDNLRYAKALSAENFDIAIAMAEGPGMRHVDRLRAKRKLGWIQKDFRTLHTSQQFFKSDRHEREAMQRFDRIVCVSETARQGVLETIGDPGNLVVRYNPINTARIRQMAEKSSGEEQPAGRSIIVTVGRLSEVKNLPTLLEACAMLNSEIPLELRIIGDGPEQDRLKRTLEIRRYSFARLLGPKQNPYPFIREADLYVSASVSETYGLSIQEALILGIPVVAVRNPGVEEALDERFGLLTGPSAEELSEGIRRMLDVSGTLETYRRRIAQDYPVQELYEKRWEAIRDLFLFPAKPVSREGE